MKKHIFIDTLNAFDKKFSVKLCQTKYLMKEKERKKENVQMGPIAFKLSLAVVLVVPTVATTQHGMSPLALSS
jgi:hypothetical protein